MQTIKNPKGFCALILGLCFSISANASSVLNSYEVSAAVSDPTYHGGGHQHALYLPAFASDMVFETGSRFEIFSDGTGMLTASAYSLSNTDLMFDVILTFSGLTETAGSMGPKKELQSHAYLENGGPVDTTTWFYFASWTGHLIGDGEAAEIDLTLEGRGAPFQWGIGANGKNVEFGGSGWFYAYRQDGSRMTGDFNLNAQPVPIPASLPFMIVALASLAMTKRRGQ
ncbi:MAG: hypothetical protein HKN70_11695 [Gammaproteobacteria bacterium]|nr:hypothetical protein [Gammaproteobacteria bacterium]